MNTLFPFIFEILINFAEVSLFFYFITHKLKIKPQYKFSIIPGILILTAFATVFNLLKLNANFSMLFFLAAQIFFAFLFMEGSVTEKFLWGCFFVIIDLSSDSLTFFISSLLTSSSASELMTQYPQRYVLTGVYLLLLITFVFIFTRNKKTRHLLPNWLLFSFLTLVIIGVIAIESLLDLSFGYPYEDSKRQLFILYMVIVIFLLFFVFVILLIICMSRLYQKNLNLLEITQQKKIEESQFTLISNTVQTLRTWKHDSKQYLHVLEELIDNEKFEDASKYIHDLCQSYEKSSWEVFTGNSIIDSVISTKLLEIRRIGIHFTYSIYLPNTLPFDSISLSSLMGNLFDNAIESCSKIEDKAGTYIDLTMKPLKNSLSIKMINSSSGEYFFNPEHTLISSKQSPNHGIGLNRITSIVEEVNGFCNIEPQKDKFLVYIVIPL